MKDSIKDDIKSLGDYLQFVTPIAFIVYSACFMTNHVSRVFVISFVVAMLICSLMKALTSAPRPREVEGDKNPDLELDWTPKSFNSWPSGHTMSTMAGGVFWLQINEWVGAIGIALGLITGLSRIIAKAHWLRDVVTSSVIAIAIYVIDVLYFL